MPSFQSYLLRFLAKRVVGVMNARPEIAEWRRLSSRGEQHPRVPRRIQSRTEIMGAVPCEWLWPAGAPPEANKHRLLYLHGGGFVLGWYNSHRMMVGHIAAACSTPALAVDYRLAPEYPFPAALDDCLAVYRALLAQGAAPRDIIIAGDSAGGNLTLALLLALKAAGDPLPAAGICLSPATDMATRGPTFKSNAHKEAILPIKLVDAAGPAYRGGADPCNPLISPLYGDLSGLPPLLIQAGEDELLLSDATRFAEKARQARTPVTLHVYSRMWHVWQAFTPYLPEAREAVDEIAAFTRLVWGLK